MACKFQGLPLHRVLFRANFRTIDGLHSHNSSFLTCKWCCLDATLKKELSLFDRLLLRVLCPTQASFSVCSGFLKGKRCLYANTKSKVPGDQVDCPEIDVDSHCFSVCYFQQLICFKFKAHLHKIALLKEKKAFLRQIPL